MALSRATGLFALAALAPLLVDDVGLLNSMVLASAYAVMALGLNIIVGFAGLLDLGYVAFFAIGAYTAVYFASGYWGIHLHVAARDGDRGARGRPRGGADRARRPSACAATTSRS